MKWVVVILIMCGLFYLGTKLMPSSSAVDVNWVESQVHLGMSREEVRSTIAGDPNSIVNSGVGQDETWYYTDRYNDQTHLAIEFIDGHVYRKAIEK